MFQLFQHQSLCSVCNCLPPVSSSELLRHLMKADIHHLKHNMRAEVQIPRALGELDLQCMLPETTDSYSRMGGGVPQSWRAHLL